VSFHGYFYILVLPQSPYPLAPKIALPRRTWVAPVWLAASKSPLMPIDNRAIEIIKSKIWRFGEAGSGLKLFP
jgi:hypothetical protein